MHVGHEKSQIIRHVIREGQVNRILEIGTYCGYSGLVMANEVKGKEGAKVISTEVDEGFATIATAIHKHAGLSNVIQIKLGTVEKLLEEIKEAGPFDLILLDHAKQLYVPDFELLEKAGVLSSSAVIVADNVIYPGTPEFLKLMKEN